MLQSADSQVYHTTHFRKCHSLWFGDISEICYISIRASIKETTLLIEVKNNGSSFEEHLLEKLETEEIQPHGFGIGLLNIHKRLLLAYGNDYGLRLINAEDELTGEEYAIVQIALPAILSETEEHISSEHFK